MSDRDELVKCKCGAKMERQVTSFVPDVWKPITLEHINVEGEGPLTFHSKQALRSYCRKHKLSSGALL